VALLKEKGIEFSYFNILADSDVREGLKEFSDWPTFPQLYISGDLVGGLDIVNEMAESGDLEKAVPKPGDLNQRLEKLVRREKVMVFIKGTREAPKCGFSRTLLGLLTDEGAEFGYNPDSVAQSMVLKQAL
jgi:glutaredoxin-related protein